VPAALGVADAAVGVERGDDRVDVAVHERVLVLGDDV
jgi:hypothetical protein